MERSERSTLESVSPANTCHSSSGWPAILRKAHQHHIVQHIIASYYFSCPCAFSTSTTSRSRSRPGLIESRPLPPHATVPSIVSPRAGRDSAPRRPRATRPVLVQQINILTDAAGILSSSTRRARTHAHAYVCVCVEIPIYVQYIYNIYI